MGRLSQSGSMNVDTTPVIYHLNKYQDNQNFRTIWIHITHNTVHTLFLVLIVIDNNLIYANYFDIIAVILNPNSRTMYQGSRRWGPWAKESTPLWEPHVTHLSTFNVTARISSSTLALTYLHKFNDEINIRSTYTSQKRSHRRISWRWRWRSITKTITMFSKLHNNTVKPLFWESFLFSHPSILTMVLCLSNVPRFFY